MINHRHHIRPNDKRNLGIYLLQWSFPFSFPPLNSQKPTFSSTSTTTFTPFDIRSSGKDLINNHLTFALYTHAAIFSKDKWPLSIRTNGHVMLNGEKMSKSKRNHLTLRQAAEKFVGAVWHLRTLGMVWRMRISMEKLANANVLREVHQGASGPHDHRGYRVHAVNGQVCSR